MNVSHDFGESYTLEVFYLNREQIQPSRVYVRFNDKSVVDHRMPRETHDIQLAALFKQKRDKIDAECKAKGNPDELVIAARRCNYLSIHLYEHDLNYVLAHQEW